MTARGYWHSNILVSRFLTHHTHNKRLIQGEGSTIKYNIKNGLKTSNITNVSLLHAIFYTSFWASKLAKKKSYKYVH
jgi:hypothetical protein